MKDCPFIFVLGVCLLLWESPGRMVEAGASTPLWQYVQEADLIVQGRILETQSIPAKRWPAYVGTDRTAVLFTSGRIEKATIRVSHVLKGLTSREVMEVTHQSESSKTFQQLIPHENYLLFLRRRRNGGGWVIMNEGRGQWRIFDYNGILKVKPGPQVPALRPPEAYQDYVEFVEMIRSHLNRPRRFAYQSDPRLR